MNTLPTDKFPFWLLSYENKLNKIPDVGWQSEYSFFCLTDEGYSADRVEIKVPHQRRSALLCN